MTMIAMACWWSASVSTAEPPRSDRSIVFRVDLDDEAITPVTARFLSQAVDQAEQERAECLVIMLDTPGGLVDSTRDVVKRILRSEVPIVVFVAPSGGRAASAGVFITLAAHVAAMSPGTNIGAAHPVQLRGLPQLPRQEPDKDEQKDSDVESPPPESIAELKTLNDTVAWARSLAEMRGRNADWAEQAVKGSRSTPATQAVDERVVELLAQDLDDLLIQLDGREVRLPSGAVRLQTARADVRVVEMWWGERTLNALANPNVAFLLLLFGLYGIVFELYTPGWGVAGTVGIICLVLGFFALAILPINYVGLALLGVAVSLFIAEAFVTSYGFLTIGGAVCLILGGLMLVDSPAGFQRISLWLLLPVALATSVITFFLVGSIVKTHRGRMRTGSEALVGAEALAIQEFGPIGDHYAGVVRVHGEIWRAESAQPVHAGQSVPIVNRRGLTLEVRNDRHPSPEVVAGHSPTGNNLPTGTSP